MKVVRTLLIVFVLLILLAGGGALYFFHKIHRAGGSDLENWIGRQIVGVLEAHLTPQVGFQNLDYRAPYTVVIEDLTLTAENRQICFVQRLLLELAEVPKLNQPIQIARVELEDPKLEFVRDPNRGFIGWTDFVRPQVREDINAPPAGQRLSDVLVLQHLEIRNGEVIYAVLDGSDPMTLPGIHLALDIPQPAPEPGWHEVKGTFKRDPIFMLDIDARLNVDSMLADVRSLRLTAALGPDQYSTLPPPIQKILREHEVKGQLVTQLSGQLPLKEPLSAQVKLDLDVQNASVASGKTVLPVQKLSVRSTLANAVVKAAYEAGLLQGTLRGETNLELSRQQAFRITWNVESIEIADTLRAVQQGEPEYAGRVSSTGQFTAMLGSLPQSISGGGKLNIDKGRLVNLPLIKQLAAVVAKVRLGVAVSPQDTAEVLFDFHPDHVYISKLDMVSALVGVRGKGQVFYDQRLNMDVQAGVLERFQGGLGQIGDILRAVSGKLISYKVTGVVGDPKVTVVPLGLGR